MGETISQRELRNDSGAIMRRVEQGECFTVTRNGVPVADLIPHGGATSDPHRRFVPVADIAAGVGRLPDWDLERFSAEMHQLDAAVDDSSEDRWKHHQVTAPHERVLLDTSVMIDYPAGAVAANAMAAAVSTITLAELAYGLHTPDPLRGRVPTAV